MTAGQDKRRYTLVLPQGLFARLETQAATEGRPVLEVIRRYVSVGLYIDKQTAEGAQFVMRHPDGSDERLIIL